MIQRAAMRDLGGRFRILAELGQGGSSRVWLAVARGPNALRKLVVLKSMKEELKSEPDLSQMFLNEAKLSAQLSHPNIVQTREVFEHEGLPVIVMEYLDGQSLAAILSQSRTAGGFPQNLGLRILSEALAGLHAAHELCDYSGTPLEVVHRDVSPHNIFVTYDGQTKVIDFGIAKLTGLAETTESGVIRGKLHYMAPEQITAGRIDRRADVYAAGIILWEMLTGVRMWRGVNEAVVMNRVLGGTLPELLAISPQTPRSLAQMVSRATAVSPDDRHPSAAEFQAELDQYLLDHAQDPRPREVGDAVARLFADHREERRIIVEHELMRVTEQSDDEYAGYRPLALTALVTQAENAAELRRKQQKERWTRALPWLLAFSLLGVLTFAFVRQEAPEKTLEKLRPRAADRVSTSAATALARVRIVISAVPSSAHIVLDGAVLPQNPFRGVFSLDPGQLHVVDILAPGHVPETRRVRFDRDQQLTFTLSPIETKAGADGADGATSRPAGDCDPPYFVDEHGVKTSKPRCQ